MMHVSLLLRRAVPVLLALAAVAGSALANEFSIGRVDERTASNGRRLIDLTVTTTNKEAVDPALIQLVVHFYVRNAQGAVVPAEGAAVSRWVSLPVDWAAGPEVLQLECPSGKALQGGSYYGVVMGIYYRGRIQASYLNPNSLSDNLPDNVPVPGPARLPNP